MNLAIRTRASLAVRRARPSIAGVDVQVLDEEVWQARRATHEARLDPYLQPHLARRAAGIRHPVHDFLFTYYSERPAQLRRWHPGYGVGLAGPGATAYSSLRGYRASTDSIPGGCVAVAPEHVVAQRELIGGIRALLAATATRPGNFGCFGLHEWAMVYRLPDEGTRHADWPLRLGHDGTDRVVETHRIVCSHFDAFRFFTPSARPLNMLQPGRDDRAELEQPGCLHATMDLYKHAFRLSPMVCSDLVADCFELAWRGARPGHARVAVRPGRPGLRAGADRDPRGPAGVRRGAA